MLKLEKVKFLMVTVLGAKGAFSLLKVKLWAVRGSFPLAL
jgi:hypothetical protein